MQIYGSLILLGIITIIYDISCCAFCVFVYLYVLIAKTEYPIQVYIAFIQSIQLRSIITFLFFLCASMSEQLAGLSWCMCYTSTH